MYYEGAENLRDLFTVRSVRDTRRLLNELWFRYPWYFKPFAPGIYEELKERRMGELVASIRPSDALADELSRLTMPVSIIWGEQDAIIPVQCAGMLSSKIPNAIVHIIPRCGHVPQLERPKAFAALVRQVLG
jgi:pimeloyl-ACP methyl ester carboxylesterase